MSRRYRERRCAISADGNAGVSRQEALETAHGLIGETQGDLKLPPLSDFSFGETSGLAQTNWDGTIVFNADYFTSLAPASGFPDVGQHNARLFLGTMLHEVMHVNRGGVYGLLDLIPMSVPILGIPHRNMDAAAQGRADAIYPQFAVRIGLGQ